MPEVYIKGAFIQTRCQSLACRIPNITSRVVCSIDGFKNHATFGISRGIWKILGRVQLDLTRLQPGYCISRVTLPHALFAA